MTKEEYENAVAYIEMIIREMNKLQKEIEKTIPPFEPPYTVKEK